MTETQFHNIFGQLYWYALVFRGISPGCQPSGATDNDLRFGSKGYGAIGYKKPLSQKQIDQYELKPLGLKNWEELS